VTNDIKLRVWTCLSSGGSLEETFAESNQEERHAARGLALSLWMQFSDKKLHLLDTMNRLSVAADQQDFEALTLGHPDRATLLALYRDEDVDDRVWASIKPTEER
jgi:hypothetical protein